MPQLAVVELPRRPAQSIRDVVTELRRRHADAHGLAAALVERLEHDHAVLVSAAQYIVATLLTAAETAETRRTSMPTREQRTRRHEERGREAKHQAKRLAAKLMLDLMMPNNKRLRFCTGAEVGAFGSAYAKIAEKVGPDNLVGEVLCEREAAEPMRAP